MEPISETILQRRKFLELTQQELGRHTGRSKKAIYDYENGSRLPTPDVARSLGNVLFRGDTKEVRDFIERCAVEKKNSRSCIAKKNNMESSIKVISDRCFVTLDVERIYSRERKVILEDWMKDLDMSAFTSRKPPEISLLATATLFLTEYQLTKDILDDVPASSYEEDQIIIINTPETIMMPFEVISFRSDGTFTFGKYKDVPSKAKSIASKEAIVSFRELCETKELPPLAILEFMKDKVIADPGVNPENYCRNDAAIIPISTMNFVSSVVQESADFIEDGKIDQLHPLDNRKLTHASLTFAAQYLQTYAQQSSLASIERGKLIKTLETFCKKLR